MKINLESYDNYKLQDVIHTSENGTVIELESKGYEETLIIEKTLTLIGREGTVLDMDQRSLQFLCDGTLTLENLTLQIKPNKDFPGIYISKGQIIFKNCRVINDVSIQDMYACIWVEEGSLCFSQSEIDVSCDLVKAINGNDLKVEKSTLKLASGKDVYFEAHGMSLLQFTRNTIQADHSLLRATQSKNVVMEDNTINVKRSSRLFIFDNIIASGDKFQINNNLFKLEKNIQISIANSHSASRKLQIYKNLIDEESIGKMQCTIDSIHGALLMDENEIHEVIISKSSEIICRRNRLERLHTKVIEQLIAIKNRVKGCVLIHNVEYLDLKKNHFDNIHHDGEAIELSEIQKFIFEENHVSSVDHGLTYHNSGECLSIRILHNEFKSCKKRGLNIVSSIQKKYLKSEVEISKNIFLKNEKALFIDDRNLKSVIIGENFFDENIEAIHITGGKQTHTLKLEGNYFGKRQLIAIRSSAVVLMQNNRVIECPISLRGIDDMSITANHFEIEHVKVTSPHEIAIKLGGSLMLRHNIFSGKIRNEKKEISKRLNITAYERTPSLVIKDNYGIQSKKTLPNIEAPDTSLIYTLRHLQNEDGEGIDHVLENEFLEVREDLIGLKKKLLNEDLKKLLIEIIEHYQISLLSNKSSNEIYRFIVRANEMKEMLKIYIQMAETLDETTENRVRDIMVHFLNFLKDTSEEVMDEEKDRLKAQMKLLEKLL